MSCLYFHRPHRDPDDSTESSDSITYWRRLLARIAVVAGTAMAAGSLVQLLRAKPAAKVAATAETADVASS
jgi:anti-sigma-K factor RskA